MAERKVVVFANRRLQRRYALDPESGAVARFRWPSPHGQEFSTRLRDVSLSGLSITLPDEMAAVETGEIVNGIELRIRGKVVHGDLLVMHVTRIDGTVAICGGLFYPQSDEDLITIRLVVRALDAES